MIDDARRFADSQAKAILQQQEGIDRVLHGRQSFRRVFTNDRPGALAWWQMTSEPKRAARTAHALLSQYGSLDA